MDAIARSHAQLLTINATLAAKAVDGLAPDELLRQPGEHGNPMLTSWPHAAAC